MSHLFWFDQEHLNRIRHLFPKPQGVARIDNQKVLSGIIHVIRYDRRPTLFFSAIALAATILFWL